jgi:choline monooxygenase
MKEMFDFWDNVNQEDIDVCEKVHVGTSAEAYQGGRFSFRFEEPLHRFQNMIADKMQADKEELRWRIPAVRRLASSKQPE